MLFILIFLSFFSLVHADDPPPLYYLLQQPQKGTDVEAIFPNIQPLSYDLPDVLAYDLKTIISARLQTAFQFREGSFFTDATGLSVTAINGLPGPFYPWFQQQIGNHGIVNLARSLGNMQAEVVSIVGYAKDPNQIVFFSSKVRGTLVSLRGIQGDNWDPIFQPEGYTKTLAEMDAVTKQALSPRRFALEQLKGYLESQNRKDQDEIAPEAAETFNKPAIPLIPDQEKNPLPVPVPEPLKEVEEPPATPASPALPPLPSHRSVQSNSRAPLIKLKPLPDVNAPENPDESAEPPTEPSKEGSKSVPAYPYLSLYSR